MSKTTKEEKLGADEKLRNLMFALADDSMAMTDEEIEDEVRAEGLDPTRVAAELRLRIRALMHEPECGICQQSLREYPPEQTEVPRRFYLERREDATGVSGTGRVAEGVMFSSGKAVLSWLTEHTSVAVYDSIETLETIHGHGGKTRVVWYDHVPKLTLEGN